MNSRKGVGIHDHSHMKDGVGPLSCGDHLLVNAQWWFNWSHDPKSCDPVGFIPMIYGPGQLSIKLPTSLNDNRVLLGYNEVDRRDITPAQAAHDTGRMIQQYKWWSGSHQIATHVVGSGGLWYYMPDYLAEIQGRGWMPFVDALAVQIYPQYFGGTLTGIEALGQVIGYANQYNVGWILVTEYNAPTVSKAQQFVNYVKAHNAQGGPQVIVFWFLAEALPEWNDCNFDLIRDGNLTEFGQMWHDW